MASLPFIGTPVGWIEAIGALKIVPPRADRTPMTLSLTARFRRPGGDMVLNLIIAILLVVDAMVALSVIDQRASLGEARPLVVAQPVATAVTTQAAPGDGGGQEAMDRVPLEQLQSALVVSQALELQEEAPVAASDLTAALPGVSFADGFTAAGPGVVGVSSTAEGILLLTQEAGGTWLCAAGTPDGLTGLGTSLEREAVSSVTGCLANPR